MAHYHQYYSFCKYVLLSFDCFSKIATVLSNDFFNLNMPKTRQVMRAEDQEFTDKQVDSGSQCKAELNLRF